MLVSILMPAYQEVATIRDILQQVLDAPIEEQGFTKEIVVCDDGSSDGTVAEVESVMAKDSRVRLIRHPVNQDKGAAVLSALAGLFAYQLGCTEEFPISPFCEAICAAVTNSFVI